MQAIEFSKIANAQIVDVKKPEPEAGQVRIRVIKAGICHSDIMAFKGQHPYRVPPVITGHEAAGEVDAIGEGVSSLAIGDRVAIEPHAGCGQCDGCRRGYYHICSNKKLIGVGSWIGAFSEFIVADESMCHQMPDEMDFEIGALLEPYCVGLHAVTLANIKEGDGVAILGCGTIGMMTLIAVGHYNPRTVIISDLSSSKREMARLIGANVAVNPVETDPVSLVRDDTNESGADIVFVTAPHKEVINQALQMTRRKGKVVLVATLPGDTEITTGEIQMHERIIIGSAMYSSKDYKTAMHQWQQGKLDNLEKLISHRVNLSEAPDLIANMAKGKGGEAIKNLINFDGTGDENS